MGILGTTEIIVILAVTLIAFGPHRLPEVAKYIAKGMKLFQEASRELRQQLELSDWDLEKPSKPYSSHTSYSPTGTSPPDTTYDESDEGYSDSYSASSDGTGDYENYGYDQTWEEENPDEYYDEELRTDVSEPDYEDLKKEPAKTDDAERYNREMNE